MTKYKYLDGEGNELTCPFGVTIVGPDGLKVTLYGRGDGNIEVSSDYRLTIMPRAANLIYVQPQR